MTAPPPGPYGPPPEGPPPGPHQPPYGPPPYGQPPSGPPAYGEPQYGQPEYGQPQYGQPEYGQPQYGQPEYGQPEYGQPQYGQPQYGQPQYGQPPHGQPPYGQPPYGQQPPYGAPPKGNRAPLIIAAAVVLAAAIGVTLFLVLRGDDNSGTQAGGPTGSGSVAGSSAPVTGASSSAPVTGSSAASDLALLRSKVVTLYAGLTTASAKSASANDPSIVGAYVAGHNNKALGYAPSECNATSAELSDPVIFLPDVSSLRADPSFTKIVNGRYAGRPVVGTPYALSLTSHTTKGESQTSTVHVAVGADGSVTFFFECE